MMPVTDASADRLASAMRLLSPAAKKYNAPETPNPIIPRIPTIDNRNCKTLRRIEETLGALVMEPAANAVSIGEKFHIGYS